MTDIYHSPRLIQDTPPSSPISTEPVAFLPQIESQVLLPSKSFISRRLSGSSTSSTIPSTLPSPSSPSSSSAAQKKAAARKVVRSILKQTRPIPSTPPSGQQYPPYQNQYPQQCFPQYQYQHQHQYHHQQQQQQPQHYLPRKRSIPPKPLPVPIPLRTSSIQPDLCLLPSPSTSSSSSPLLPVLPSPPARPLPMVPLQKSVRWASENEVLEIENLDDLILMGYYDDYDSDLGWDYRMEERDKEQEQEQRSEVEEGKDEEEDEDDLSSVLSSASWTSSESLLRLEDLQRKDIPSAKMTRVRKIMEQQGYQWEEKDQDDGDLGDDDEDDEEEEDCYDLEEESLMAEDEQMERFLMDRQFGMGLSAFGLRRILPRTTTVQQLEFFGHDSRMTTPTLPPRDTVVFPPKALTNHPATSASSPSSPSTFSSQEKPSSSRIVLPPRLNRQEILDRVAERKQAGTGVFAKRRQQRMGQSIPSSMAAMDATIHPHPERPTSSASTVTSPTASLTPSSSGSTLAPCSPLAKPNVDNDEEDDNHNGFDEGDHQVKIHLRSNHHQRPLSLLAC